LFVLKVAKADVCNANAHDESLQMYAKDPTAEEKKSRLTTLRLLLRAFFIILARGNGC
jgi:hypothetical protein